MTTSLSEELFVGLVAFALVPWTAWTIIRGLRQERLPIGRAYVSRDRQGAFHLLLAFYFLAGLMAAFIAVDLLFGFDLRQAL
jgi:hypothetical protein